MSIGLFIIFLIILILTTASLFGASLFCFYRAEVYIGVIFAFATFIFFILIIVLIFVKFKIFV